MKMRVLAAMVAACLSTASIAVGPTVTNVRAYQDGKSKKVFIEYTLLDPDSASVYVSVAISTNGGSSYSVTPTSASGDIGWVRPGGVRRIEWNAKTDYPNAQWTSCKAKVYADDGAGGGVYPGEMVYIPAGSFLMGNRGNEPYSYSDEFPQHSVYLSGYWIGKYEVTRGEYRRFIEAGGYNNPVYWSQDGWNWRQNYNITEPYCWSATQDWGTGTFTQTDRHPVVGVSYYEAEAYCKWAGARLPTEAEWEKAARWTGNYPRTYPWGDVWNYEYCNNFYDANPAGGGYEKCQTAPVGSYPQGVSYYGCHDMAGNVWEWCKDWYLYDYYSQTPSGGWINPQGPSYGSYRVVRGGGWYYYNICRCAGRYDYYPYYYSSFSNGSGIGFRIAR